MFLRISRNNQRSSGRVWMGDEDRLIRFWWWFLIEYYFLGDLRRKFRCLSYVNDLFATSHFRLQPFGRVLSGSSADVCPNSERKLSRIKWFTKVQKWALHPLALHFPTENWRLSWLAAKTQNFIKNLNSIVRWDYNEAVCLSKQFV